MTSIGSRKSICNLATGNCRVGRPLGWLGGGSLLLDRILAIILAGVHFKRRLDELIVRSLEFF